ncbi:aldehyde dehydrogenase family protein [Pseudomonas qingdaonensis]|nr:aldehyde dehydrogenase family protein [Pseudomonas qingdaonensis]
MSIDCKRIQAYCRRLNDVQQNLQSLDQWRRTGASNNQHIERLSPAHGGLLARFASGTEQDVDTAVAHAKALHVAGTWAALPGSERAKLLNRLAELIERDADRLAQIEAEEVGKPIVYAKGEVLWSAELTRFAASWPGRSRAKPTPHLGEDKLGLVTRQARGVVGLIVPWNFPMVCLFQKLPYALAAGCPVVIKPSELTSGTALEVARLATEAGFPAGLINVVTGSGSVVGERLTRHPDVSMISFTGSTRVGKQIAATAAGRPDPRGPGTGRQGGQRGIRRCRPGRSAGWRAVRRDPQPG